MTAMPQPRRAKRKKPASLSEFLCRESVAGYMFISLLWVTQIKNIQKAEQKESNNKS